MTAPSKGDYLFTVMTIYILVNSIHKINAMGKGDTYRNQVVLSTKANGSMDYDMDMAARLSAIIRMQMCIRATSKMTYDMVKANVGMWMVLDTKVNGILGADGDMELSLTRRGEFIRQECGRMTESYSAVMHLRKVTPKG